MSGRIDRAARWLYERVGPRMVFVCIAGGAVLTILNAVVADAVAARYLGFSTRQAVSSFLVALPVALLLGAAGVLSVAPQVRAVLAWSERGRRAELAPQTWYATVGLSRAVTRCALIMYPLIPLAIVYVLLHYHEPWYLSFPLFIGGIPAVGGNWVLVVSGSEVLARPMVEEIAAYLPADFEPKARTTSLTLRALAPLPVVTMFSAIIVGAYTTNFVRSGPSRMVFATAVALATTAVATAIFVLLNRSVLSPIDDLIAATRRVREGDISTPVPLVSGDELGALAVSFNEMLADLRRHTEELRASRERIVAAADEGRRRVERDLHDGAQQQLVLLRLKLDALRRDPGRVELIDEIRDDLERGLAELRDLAHGLYPTVLETDGLPGALLEAVDRAAIPATLDCDGTRRYRPELEAAVYFCCLEALQNASKHAGEGARVGVRLSEREQSLRFEVADDGHGFDPATGPKSSGLQNMSDRIGAIGGELRIDSRPGAGTTVSGTIPLGGD